MKTSTELYIAGGVCVGLYALSKSNAIQSALSNALAGIGSGLGDSLESLLKGIIKIPVKFGETAAGDIGNFFLGGNTGTQDVTAGNTAISQYGLITSLSDTIQSDLGNQWPAINTVSGSNALQINANYQQTGQNQQVWDTMDQLEKKFAPDVSNEIYRKEHGLSYTASMIPLGY